MTSNENDSLARVALDVRGAVQGVGFRPFVCTLARALGLAGFVQNTRFGVRIEIAGKQAHIAAFTRRLRAEAPAHARIDAVTQTRLDAPPRANGAAHDAAFVIRPSQDAGATTAVVLPDLATCAACMAEVRDPHDRRHGYVFTSCTACGPRFSIVRALPFDRERTTMAGFAMCAPCQAEYQDPHDRRFHAQTNACPACGPRLAWWDASGAALPGADDQDVITRARSALHRGNIVAVKGLGGFQLMVDARQPDAIARLRARKHRPDKPFAVLFASLDEVRAHCTPSAAEEALLASSAAPIVLVKRARQPGSQTCPDAPIVAGVAPQNPHIGAMLPCTPLHALLAQGGPLVATSGNLSGEPLCTDEHEAVRRLGNIADFFLVHDRPIAQLVDDSVARIMANRPMIIRRARGYAPLTLGLGADALPPILATGGHMKSAIAFTSGTSAVLGPHIGDLDTAEAHDAFARAVQSARDLYHLAPRVVACDAHPDYHSTRMASILASQLGCTVGAVQHHHAHVRACMAEHGLDAPVLGVAWDGTGLGTDGTIWGGEFVRIDARHEDAKRVAHLRGFPLPGGDAAARQPRRAALGVLCELTRPTHNVDQFADIAAVAAFAPHERALLIKAMEQGVNAPRTSSAGRLFDAVAAITGLVQHATFEGQAAMALEHAAGSMETAQEPMQNAAPGHAHTAYPFALYPPADASAGALAGASAGALAGTLAEALAGTLAEALAEALIVDWGPLIHAVIADVRAKVPVNVISARFHNTLAAMIVAVAVRTGCRQVVLTGGCFQNQRLTELAVQGLRAAGCEPYWHEQVPPNDGGLALGQLAATLHAKERAHVPSRARTDHQDHT